MADPTLLICIGATKAGTTWLYHYMLGHPDCHFRTVKELHYFDGIGEPEDSFFRVAQKRYLGERKAKLARIGWSRWRDRRAAAREVRDMRDWLKLRIPGQTDHGAYMQYLRRGLGGRKVMGDFTPCYAALGAADFAQMYALPVRARFLFLLRDPVDRLWSHMRMRSRMQSARAGGKPKEHVEWRSNRLMKKFLTGGHRDTMLRSDYKRTITELESVVPPEDIHYAFYEDLYTDAQIFALNDFLGIRHLSGDYGQVRFGGHSQGLDEELRRGALSVMAEQYAFCEAKFDGYLPDRWRQQQAGDVSVGLSAAAARGAAE